MNRENQNHSNSFCPETPRPIEDAWDEKEHAEGLDADEKEGGEPVLLPKNRAIAISTLES